MLHRLNQSRIVNGSVLFIYSSDGSQYCFQCLPLTYIRKYFIVLPVVLEFHDIAQRFCSLVCIHVVRMVITLTSSFGMNSNGKLCPIKLLVNLFYTRVFNDSEARCKSSPLRRQMSRSYSFF